MPYPNPGGKGIGGILIEDGAHHLDLMFSNEQDPQSVKDARALELSFIRSWITDHEVQLMKRYSSRV